MITVHKNEIIKIHHGCGLTGVTDEELNFMGQAASLQSNLKELIVLWRDINRGNHGMVVASDSEEEGRATVTPADLQYLSSRERPHQSKQKSRFIKLQEQQAFVG
jgi:hypothetical protein